MTALILTAYNTPFVLQEVATPVAGQGEVLVRILASAINPLDLKIRAGQAAHAKTRLPAILGIDMAGVVESVGEGITGFKPGDEVYGMTGREEGIFFQGHFFQYKLAVSYFPRTPLFPINS